MLRIDNLTFLIAYCLQSIIQAQSASQKSGIKLIAFSDDDLELQFKGIENNKVKVIKDILGAEAVESYDNGSTSKMTVRSSAKSTYCESKTYVRNEAKANNHSFNIALNLAFMGLGLSPGYAYHRGMSKTTGGSQGNERAIEENKTITFDIKDRSAITLLVEDCLTDVKTSYDVVFHIKGDIHYCISEVPSLSDAPGISAGPSPLPLPDVHVDAIREGYKQGKKTANGTEHIRTMFSVPALEVRKGFPSTPPKSISEIKLDAKSRLNLSISVYDLFINAPADMSPFERIPDRYTLSFEYGTRPTDDQIQKHILYLYQDNGHLWYTAINPQRGIETIEIQRNELRDAYDGIVIAMQDQNRTSLLSDMQVKALFDATSKHGFMREDGTTLALRVPVKVHHLSRTPQYHCYPTKSITIEPWFMDRAILTQSGPSTDMARLITAGIGAGQTGPAALIETSMTYATATSTTLSTPTPISGKYKGLFFAQGATKGADIPSVLVRDERDRFRAVPESECLKSLKEDADSKREKVFKLSYNQ